MSSKYYSKQWSSAIDDLKKLIATEKQIHKIPPIENQLTAHSILARLYVRYIIVVNDLSNIFDQTIQFQRRDVIKQLLSAVCSRMLELKEELCKMEMTEFVYVDASLIEEQIIPKDVQLTKCLPFRRADNIQFLINSFRETRAIQSKDSANDQMVSVVEDQAKSATSNFTYTANDNELKCQSIEDIKFAQIHIDSYKFLHEEDTKSLYPITKTIYPANFYVDKTTDQMELYTNLKKGASEAKMAPNSSIEIVESVEQSIIQSRPPRIFDSAEWIRCLNAPKKTESQILREELQKVKEMNAANCIKRAWRISRFRRSLQRSRLQKMKFIGIIEVIQDQSDLQKIQTDVYQKRRSKQAEYAKEYNLTITSLTTKINANKSVWIEEDIVDYVHNWFRETYDVCKKFDNFPRADAGGSALIWTGEVMSPEEFMLYMQKTPKERKAEAKAAKAAAKEISKKLAAEKKAKKEKAKASADAGFPFWDFSDQDFVTAAFQNIERILQAYELDWRFIDIYHITSDQPIVELIETDIYHQLQTSMREMIDVVMRADLEKLQMALCKDTRKKYKPPKEPKAKPIKESKGELPLIDYETTVSLFDDLVTAGIIMDYPKVALDDYIADLNYSAYEFRNYIQKDPIPGGLEIIHVLRSWSIGMGLLDMQRIRSICIAGPSGCGKKFLVEGLATELDAALLSISPEVVSKYAQNVDNFIYLIINMAKVLQPTIIFMNGIHRVYCKKPAQEDMHLNPQLIVPYLPKIMNSINPTDRIMVIGTTNQPWLCNARAIKKMFEKQLLIPMKIPTFAQAVWRVGIERKLKSNPLFTITPLANATRTFSVASILACIDRVLDDKRIRRMPFIPLQAQEFLDDLLQNSTPNAHIADEMLEKYQTWYQKTNALENRRITILAKKTSENADPKKDKKK